jgi:hypothetical protein
MLKKMHMPETKDACSKRGTCLKLSMHAQKEAHLKLSMHAQKEAHA